MLRSTRFTFVLVILALAGIGGTQAALAQSGDATIDDIIAPYANRAGNSLAPINIAPANYQVSGRHLYSCNSSVGPSWEGSCPSDLTYTPNQNTGGGQSFGVGIQNYPAGQYWYAVPYLEQVWYHDTNCDCDTYYWDVAYDLYLVNLPAFTTGTAAAGSKWGTTVYQITPTVAATLSTAAFKASALTPCVPDYLLETAPCGGLLAPTDATYVASAGYEDKVVIAETCGLSTRSGTSSDGDSGCFYGYEGWTTFPGSVYMDTTADDSGPYYVPGIGITRPDQLPEGTKYYWLIDFFAYGNEPVTGQPVSHNGAVTYRVGWSPFCIAYESQWGNGACYFNVDQTGLAPSSGLF
jgi:hypothetical protein